MPRRLPSVHRISDPVLWVIRGVGRGVRTMRLRLPGRLSLGLCVAALATTTACAPAAAPSAPAANSAAASPSTDAAGPACVPNPARVSSAADPGTGTLPSDLVAKLDAAAASAYRQAATPGAIAGVQTPSGTWIKAYGVADPATKAPMSVGMHTRIGSLTKPFTVTKILQLAEQGRVSLDDPIATFVDGVPNGDRITLRLLANMTSGVASYSQSEAWVTTMTSAPATVFTHDELIEIGLKLSPLFDPGEKFDYSNTNTLLLGKVIEKVTGQTAAAAITETVLKPLGMTHTTWPGSSPAIPKPYPQGFTLQSPEASAEKPVNSTHWNPSWQWTAGELISTADDLLRGAHGIGTGQGILSAGSQAERLRSVPGATGYGLGFGCGNGWVGHSGEVPGYSTSMFYDTINDYSVIVQTNSDIASGSCEASPTLQDNPADLPCSAPSVRVLVALTDVLGNRFEPPARK